MKRLTSLLSCFLLMTWVLQAQTTSFTATQWASEKSLTSGSTVTDYTQAPITLSFSQGSGSQVTYNGTAIAAGEGNTLTITAATGYQLTAMSFTQNVAAQATRLAGNTWSAGSASVNAQNNKQVDWIGAAQTVSVTFTGNQVFTAFSVTYEDMNKSFIVTFVGADGAVLKTKSVLYGNAATPPTPPAITNKVFTGWDKDYTNITEDITITALYDFSPEVMKDTVRITPKEIMDYNELTSGEYFDAVDFTKDGVTIAVSKGSASGSPRILYDGYYSNYPLRLGTNHTITISAPFKIHKVVMGTWYLSDDDSFTCNTGEISKGELNVILRDVIWTGSTSRVTITIGSTQSWDFSAIYFHIIGDKTDTQCNVTFYDFEGNMLTQQQVTAGGSIATPPTISDACFAGWDKSLSGIYEDLDVHPVREKLLDLTATAWRDSETGSKRITEGDFTLIPINRWKEESADFGETNMGNWVYIPHLTLRTGNPLTIVGKDWFQNLTMICPDGQAAKLAAATFSSGTAKQTGNNVLWSGDTDSLVITPTQDCNFFEFVIYCQEHETPSFTVVFLDENDNELKRETVARGSSVTPPAYTAPDDCHIFRGWDKDLSRVRGDMTVRPVLETKVIQSLSAIGWARLQNDSANNTTMQDVETNGYSFSTPNSVLHSTKQRIDGKWVNIYYITVYRGGTISISSDNYVRNITFTVLNEHDAENLAAATYSQGSATRDSIRVTWTGATDNLEITLPDDDNIGLSLIEINCEVVTDHKVTILDKDGKVLKSETVTDGGSVTPPEDQTPENECYVFKGWSEKLTNIHTDLTVKPVFEYIDGCTPEGFVKVTFVDFAGNLIESSFVETGGTAVAPEAPELPFHTFTGWDHALDNLKAEQISEEPTSGVRVKLDPESCGTWTEVYLYEWNNWGDQPLGEWPGTKVSKDMYGWWSYTYEETGERNIIWNNGKSEQTVDINGVSESTCYQLDGKDGEKYKVKTADCPNHADGIVIRPLYTFNKVAEGILSVKEATDIIDSIKNKYDYKEKHIDEYHAVKGVVYLTSELSGGGRLSVRITEDGQYDYGTSELRGYSMLGPNLEQFVSKMQLQQGDTVILFGKFIQDRFSDGYGSKEWGLGKGYIPYIGKKTSDEGIVYIDMPDAATMYDLSGDGKKQALYVSSDNNLIVSGNYSNDFLFEKSLYSGLPSTTGRKTIFLADINHDSEIDLGIATRSNYGDFSATSLLSGDEDYTKVDGAIFLPQFDLNGDGRTDHLVVDPKSWFVPDFGAGGGLGYGQTYRANYYYVGNQQPDGTYNLEYVQAMSWDEYEELISGTEWAATVKEKTYSSGNSLITPNYNYSSALEEIMRGVSISIGHAPRKPIHSASVAQELRRAPSIGYTVNSITKALDLNADNLIDLIDEKNGNVYLNMGGGQFVLAQTNGMVVPADLNNDGLMDFIFPGEKLYTSIYKGEGKFDTKTIYENAAVDDLLYCYDFDRDGDIDILATFSAMTNATKTAYTCFFLNDGNGNFTQQPEQNYGTDNLWFSALQDIDGDGYFDLLAFRGNIDSNYKIDNTYVDENGYTNFKDTEVEIVWLRGGQNNTFASPSVLYNLVYSNSGWGSAMNVSECRINAEDLDNDGKAEIWVSGLEQGKTRIFTTEFGDKKTFSVTANTAPTAPAAPELRYDNGILTVTWGNGQDKETMTGDLTYALRLGTTQGGNDILSGFANADGSRRNFLDGNMGKNHSYMIDLSTYAPATVYASVQAIDAQHKGSAWSAETKIEHSVLPAQFTLSQEKIAFNEVVTVSYTSLPDGYSHKWLYDDGELRRDGSLLKLSFPTAGEKVITHTVTAPDGRQATYAATLTVLPAGLSTEAIELTDWNDYNSDSNNLNTMRGSSKADFNGDGLLDVFYNSFIAQATSLTEYTQATGLWNTNITSGSDQKWLDWNKNGYADLLICSFSQGYHNYILPHADNAQDMTAQKEDAGIEGTLRYLYRTETSDGYILTPLAADMLNNGVPSIFAYTGGDYEDACFRMRQSDGSFAYLPVTTTGDAKILYQALANAMQNGQWSNDIRDGLIDYNHDGFTDILFLKSEYKDNVDKYSNLYIVQNNGNADFTQLTVPLANEIASNDLQFPKYADLNNDGYIDIIAGKANNGKYAMYILWNERNLSFSEPDILPVSEIGSFDNYDNFLIDIDNDGYLDILSWQKNPVGNDVTGLYVWYMGAQGVKTQGFLIPSGYGADGALFTDFPNELLYKESYNNRIHLRRVVSVNENKNPSAPQGLRAVQTEDGLLVEWNAAEDDHTLASQMRYNLSVKHAGRTGEGAFVISPQNGLNSKSAYLPGHKYINATRMLVPLSFLTAGDYEIQVQAIDQRNLMSDFSDVVTVNIDRQIIDAPTTVCTYDEVTVTYMSEDRTGTPVWDFDGGAIVSGSGFGPYRVSWEDEGTKTITLTIGDKTYTRMLYADQVSGWADLPAALFDGGSVDVSWSDNLYGELEISINGTVQSITAKGIDNRDPQLTFDGHTLKLDTRRAWSKENALTNFSSLELILTLTNANGCAGELRKSVEIISLDNSPQIALVTSDADGHNIISWNADADLFPKIQILKETNIRDQFVELGVVSTIDGRYTDLSSDATQRAERYAIRGIMNGGTLTPASPVHQTVHTTINRGVNDNQWNLIWNQYVGADVVTYNILRGSAEGTLTQIASVSSYNTSYTDYAPQDAQPYYAIEYVLSGSEQPSLAPGYQRAPENPVNPVNPIIRHAPQASSLQGRSNIVNRSAAKTMTYAQSLTILSANGKYETTADNTMLLLYAEVMPSNTTYKQVIWEITEGESLASIDQSSGLITARTPNNGGTITVRATAVDGSGVTATRQIRIAAIKDNTPVEPTYFTVTFYSWDGTVITTQTVEQGKSATAPQAPQRDGYTFVGWDKAFTNVQSDLSVTAQYRENGTPVDYTPKNLRTEQNGNLVYFLWDAVQGATEYEFVLTQNENIIYSAAIDHNGVGLDFGSQQPGNYSVEWKVRTTLPEVSDWATATYTIVVTDIDEVEVQKQWSPRKVIEDGHVYIILPDGTRYDATGQRVR